MFPYHYYGAISQEGGKYWRDRHISMLSHYKNSKMCDPLNMFKVM